MRSITFGTDNVCENCIYFNDETTECECVDSDNYGEEVDELDSCVYFEEV